jgi:pimeloyl-ACP methyl ester carboxylesterase
MDKATIPHHPHAQSRDDAALRAGLVGDLHIVQSGPPSAPTVVLLHGLGGSTAWWEPVLPALPDLYVVRVELLGHGSSARPAGGYGIAEQARRVGAVLDHLGVRRATLVGHSTGGMVATSLAEQRPDLVTALALIDTGPRTDAFIGDNLISRLLSVPVVGAVALAAAHRQHHPWRRQHRVHP